MMAGYFGIASGDVPDKRVTDPFAAVRVDVECLRANPFISPTLVVSGLVYDVGSGFVEVGDGEPVGVGVDLGAGHGQRLCGSDRIEADAGRAEDDHSVTRSNV